ncbi:MAG: Trk family potassium uptake protein [Candidatus Coatesbacteria bacterium]|nr:Trk family potassium uptake protein [Candidatus Coatesbacteria bacterium]
MKKAEFRKIIAWLVHSLAFLVALKVLIILGYKIVLKEELQHYIDFSEYALLISFWVYVIISYIQGSYKFFAYHEKLRNLYLIAVLALCLFSPLYAKWLVFIFLLTELMDSLSNKPLIRNYMHYFLSKPSILIPLTFIVTILAGAFFLTLPIATVDGRGASFVDAFFTSCSATCVTGLIVQDTEIYWTKFGQIVILLLIQIGALGIMTLSASVAYMVGLGLGLRSQVAMKDLLDTDELSNLKSTLLFIVKMTFSVEAAGAVILSARFYTYTRDIGFSIYSGIFHSISAFGNAGFSLFSKNLENFKFDPIILLTIAGLIITGGIGFLAVMSIMSIGIFRHGIRESWNKLNTHTKITLLTTLCLIFGGMAFIYFFEVDRSLKDYSVPTQLLSAFFQSVTTRTAGFNSIPFDNLNRITVLIIIILMFIGAAPGSTGGGIKVTTFAVLLLTVRRIMTGKNDVEAFNRSISENVVVRSIAILTTQSTALIVIFLLLLYIQPNFKEIDLLFESVSALGTVGLSLGITSSLSSFGKCLMIILMFLGRIGPLTIVLAIGKKHREYGIRYPQGRIMVG